MYIVSRDKFIVLIGTWVCKNELIHFCENSLLSHQFLLSFLSPLTTILSIEFKLIISDHQSFGIPSKLDMWMILSWTTLSYNRVILVQFSSIVIIIDRQSVHSCPIPKLSTLMKHDFSEIFDDFQLAKVYIHLCVFIWEHPGKTSSVSQLCLEKSFPETSKVKIILIILNGNSLFLLSLLLSTSSQDDSAETKTCSTTSFFFSFSLSLAT